jgi:protein TonB
MVVHPIDLPRRRRARRVWFVFLAGSVAAHAAVLILVPPLAPDPSPPGGSKLEVVILQPEPLLSSEPESSARTRAKNEPKARPESPAPSVALSESMWDERRAFAVDAVFSGSEPPVLEQKAEALGAAPASFEAGYLRNPLPRYPLAARRAGEHGTVTLRVLVTRDGLPARVDVEKSSGSTHLDRAALEAVRAWRFAPARQGAEPVESWLLVPVVFRLEGSG